MIGPPQLIVQSVPDGPMAQSESVVHARLPVAAMMAVLTALSASFDNSAHVAVESKSPLASSDSPPASLATTLTPALPPSASALVLLLAEPESAGDSLSTLPLHAPSVATTRSTGATRNLFMMARSPAPYVPVDFAEFAPIVCAIVCHTTIGPPSTGPRPRRGRRPTSGRRMRLGKG